MYCPISQADPNSLGDCLKANCAWWCPDSDMCAIKKIAIKDELMIPATKNIIYDDARLLEYGS